MAECRLPFSFNVVPKLPVARRKRKRPQIEQEGDLPTPGPRVTRIGDVNITAQNQHPALDIDHQDAAESCEESKSSLPPVPPLTLPLEASWSADSSSAPQEVIKPPSQAIAPPRTDGECAPTLTQVNPESGSTTGGAVIWLAGNDFPAHFPLYARFGTTVVRTVSSLVTCEALSNRVSQAFINPSLLTCHLPPAAAPGIVDVTLSKHPLPHASEYGASIAKFHYITDYNQL